MIHYDPQYSEGECSRESSPEQEALNASQSYTGQESGSQGFSTRQSNSQGASASSLGQQASQGMEQVKNQVIQTSNELTESVKTRASSFLDQQKSMASEIMQDMTEATRHCSDELRQKNHPRLSETINIMADRMQDFTQSLQRQDVNYFVNRTQNFARQRPVLFLGGALALGFLAVRFLRSSGPTTGQYEHPSTQPQQSYIQGIHNEVPASSGTQFTI